MKKAAWIVLLITLISLFSLSSCDIVDTAPNDHRNQQTTGGTENNNGTESSGTPHDSTVCYHTFGDWVTVKQATCKEEGRRTPSSFVQL